MTDPRQHARKVTFSTYVREDEAAELLESLREFWSNHELCLYQLRTEILPANDLTDEDLRAAGETFGLQFVNLTDYECLRCGRSYVGEDGFTDAEMALVHSTGVCCDLCARGVDSEADHDA